VLALRSEEWGELRRLARRWPSVQIRGSLLAHDVHRVLRRKHLCGGDAGLCLRNRGHDVRGLRVLRKAVQSNQVRSLVPGARSVAPTTG
jgi:hypothetical protein